MSTEFILNGEKVKVDVPSGEVLLQTLRDLGCVSVKDGCSEAGCGTCTVWVNEKPVLSCNILTVRCSGCKITTLEGIQDEARKVGECLMEEASEQCGYCSPGLIMTVLALKRENPHPSKEQIESYIKGNLCRCSGYQSRRRALMKYFEKDGCF